MSQGDGRVNSLKLMRVCMTLGESSLGGTAIGEPQTALPPWAVVR